MFWAILSGVVGALVSKLLGFLDRWRDRRTAREQERLKISNEAEKLQNRLDKIYEKLRDTPSSHNDVVDSLLKRAENYYNPGTGAKTAS